MRRDIAVKKLSVIRFSREEGYFHVPKLILLPGFLLITVTLNDKHRHVAGKPVHTISYIFAALKKQVICLTKEPR